MDLRIAGRKAIVCASSDGLGFACARALAEAGCELVMNGRRPEVLEAAAEELRRRTGTKVTAVTADVATPAGRAALLAACREPDILVNNSGGPPKKDFRALTEEDWAQALQGNMLAAVALITASVDGMMDRGFGRIVNITSMTSVRPVTNLDLSNAARLGLAGFVAGVSRQVAGRNVTINNLLPGSFATARVAALGAAATEVAASVPAGRLGDPDEFGDTCAFLCGAQAGYIVGQNLLIDGGFCMNAL
jgi:3-oxoacyl-[acyl-carrier protein] reductase